MKPYIYIPVRKKEIIIDRQDYEWVRFLQLSIDQKGYCVSSSRFMLHRLVRGLIPNDNQMVDHINGNKLDNRRSNLRICSSKDNAINSKPHKRQKHSYYKGVSKAAPRAKLEKEWGASLTVGNKNVYLGWWMTELEAAMAYDKAQRHFYPGVHKKLNFPNVTVYSIQVPNVDFHPKVVSK